MEEFDYPGIRVMLEATLDKMRQPIKIDISTDDVITPRAIEYDYKLMFEDRTISVLTYNKETLLAEKMQTIINRGIANTRLRDFYDVDLKADELRKAHILSSTRENNIDTFIFDSIINLKKYEKLDASNLYNVLLQNESVINYLNGPNTSIESSVSEGLESYSYDIGYILGNYANSCDNKSELLNWILQIKSNGLKKPFTIDENIIADTLENHRFMNK